MGNEFIPGIATNGKPVTAFDAAVLQYRAGGCVEPDKFKYKVWPHYDAGACLTTKHPLKKFQNDGIIDASQILSQYTGCFIADEMGLGKTIEAIVLSQYARVGSCLVVVPANVIKQWQKQWFKWTDNVLTICKTKKEAAAWNVDAAPFTLITYELLDSLVNGTTVPKFDMIIYDEIQKLRGRSTKMSLAARALRDNNRNTYIVGLTGSLQWGHTRDLWNPIRCVLGYRFGNADQFDFAYCGAYFNEHGGKVNKGHTSADGVDRSAELAIRLSYVSIARTRREVAAELPAFERRIHRIPSTPKATLALHSYLRKELPYMNAIMSSTAEKTKPVLELLESMRNAVVFTWTKADVGRLSMEIEATGKTVYTITGNTSKEERAAIIKQATEQQATIVATIDSTGVGVDGLQHVTSNVIFHSLSHSPKLHLQAEARLMRIGQKNPVTCTYIVMNDSADELVISVIATKSAQDVTTGGIDGQSMATTLKMDDAYLQSALDAWVKSASDEIGNGGDDGALNHEGWEEDENDDY